MAPTPSPATAAAAAAGAEEDALATPPWSTGGGGGGDDDAGGALSHPAAAQRPLNTLVDTRAPEHGTAQAAAAAGVKSRVVVTGMNGIPPAVRAVKKGAMDLTVVLNPVKWGFLGVNTMNAYLSGKKFDAKVYVGHALVDKTNVDKFIRKKK